MSRKSKPHSLLLPPVVATLVVIAIACGGTRAIHGQQPTDAAADVKTLTTKQRAFSIPVTIDNGSGATPREVQLLGSTDQGRNWKVFDRQQPDQPAFKFRADGDGEYWFASRTIDDKGRGTPSGAPKPELKVIIDGTPPKVDLLAEATPEGRVKVTWKAEDLSIRPDGIRLEYQAGEVRNPTWLPVPVAAKDVRRNETSFWGESVFDPKTPIRLIDLRLIVRDGAGNSSSATAQAILSRATPKTNEAVGPKTAPTSPRVTAQPKTAAPSGQPNDPFLRRRQAESAEIADEPPAQGDAASPDEVAESTGQAWPADNRPPQDVADAPAPVVPSKSLGLRHNRGQADDPPAGGTSTTTNPIRGKTAGQDVARHPSEESSAANTDAVEIAASSPFGKKNPAQSSTIDGPYTRPFANRGKFASLPAGDDEATPKTSPPSSDSVYGDEPLDDVSDRSGPPQGEPEGESRSFEGPTGDRPRAVNDKHIKLDYDLDGVGPAGVKAVELWGTKDGGKTWDRWGEDDDKRSPFEIHVESEANFGFCMVVVSNNGLASKPPQAGDPADVWITVDTTAPTVRLEQAACGQGEHAGKLDIRWKAEDAHMGDRPISIAFSEKQDGPWVTVAAGLPNNGQYLWAVDSRTPRKLYLKIEARDEAGNVASDIPVEPISLEGLTPRGKIKSAAPQNQGKSSAFKTPLFK